MRCLQPFPLLGSSGCILSDKTPVFFPGQFWPVCATSALFPAGSCLWVCANSTIWEKGRVDKMTLVLRLALVASLRHHCRALSTGTKQLPVVTLFTKKHVRAVQTNFCWLLRPTCAFVFWPQVPCSLCDVAKDALMKYSAQVSERQ